ncbi:MAG: hypothetical protein KDI72_08150, partial [Xanthomonadales bacterium]|nr:hypothetical protein [Xanthomonadales bacterium]
MASNGDPQGAREVLQRVLAITPDEPSLLRSVAVLEMVERNYLAALRAARKALAADPQGPANIHAMLDVELQIEDFDAASELARRLPEDTRDRQTTLQWIEFRRGSLEMLPQMA